MTEAKMQVEALAALLGVDFRIGGSNRTSILYVIAPKGYAWVSPNTMRFSRRVLRFSAKDSNSFQWGKVLKRMLQGIRKTTGGGHE